MESKQVKPLYVQTKKEVKEKCQICGYYRTRNPYLFVFNEGNRIMSFKPKEDDIFDWAVAERAKQNCDQKEKSLKDNGWITTTIVTAFLKSDGSLKLNDCDFRIMAAQKLYDEGIIVDIPFVITEVDEKQFDKDLKLKNSTPVVKHNSIDKAVTTMKLSDNPIAVKQAEESLRYSKEYGIPHSRMVNCLFGSGKLRNTNNDELVFASEYDLKDREAFFKVWQDMVNHADKTTHTSGHYTKSEVYSEHFFDALSNTWKALYRKKCSKTTISTMMNAIKLNIYSCTPIYGKVERLTIKGARETINGIMAKALGKYKGISDKDRQAILKIACNK